MLVLQIRDLNKVLETEKAARIDLELYVAVLGKQKNVMQDEADQMRDELKDGKDLAKYVFIGLCRPLARGVSGCLLDTVLLVLDTLISIYFYASAPKVPEALCF